MSRTGAWRLAVVATFVLALEAAVRLAWLPRTVMVAPSEMTAALLSGLISGKLVRLAVPTLITVAIAIVLALLVGVVLGLLLHGVPRLRRALDPLLTSYYAVPIFVFYPVLIVLLGMGRPPLVVMGAGFGAIVVALSLVQGLERMPVPIIKAARLERMGAVETVRLIHLPFVAPYLMHGVKLAVSYAFIGVIGGEFILAPAGLGHAIAFAYNDFDNLQMYALILLVVVLVTSINFALLALERRLTRRRGMT